MALARTGNQLLRSQGNDTTTVAANYPITGDGSTQLPLGLAEDYRGADGESLTFNITDIENGHQVTISGIQGSSSFNVLNGQNGSDGANGVNGADGQSVTFDITNIASGHRVTLSGAQGSASFDVMNGQNGVDGISPTFRFSEDASGVIVYVSGAQGEESFRLYNATGEGGSTYSAGSFIDIYDVEGQKYISANISAGTPWLSGWKEISTLSLNFGDSVQIVSSHDFSGFHNHAIGLKGAVVTLPSTAHIGSALDDKLDTSSFNNFISTEYSTAKSDIYNSAAYLMQNKLDKSESGNFYPMSGNPSGFLTAHQDITNLPYVQNNALNYTPSTFVSGISGNALYAESANHAFTAETANYVEGGWEYDSENHISSYNGSAFVGQNQATYDVKAGSNINVATAGNTFTVSGKDWSSNLNSKLDTTTFNTYTAAHTADDNTAYTAGDNITITNHVISSKNWTNDITAASSYAYSQATADAQGHTYTGVAPIVVNNNEDKISANCIELSAGNGIDSNLLAIGTIAVSSHGGGNFSSSAFGINPSQQVTALTSLSYYDTGVGNSNQLSGNDTNNLGWTMPSAYANVKSDVIADADAQVQSRYSYKLSYSAPTTGFTSNSGLEIRKYVGNNVTTRKVLSGDSTIGELVPEDYNSRQYLSTNAAGNMVWDDIANISPIVLVATSGDIPASGASDNKVYIVTGNSQ